MKDKPLHSLWRACLLKGLGAPVGFMLLGSHPMMDRARSVRKALGGGMRQAGILAAAGLIALEEMPARLGEEHANARLMADTLAACAGVELDPKSVQTNIVIFGLKKKSSADVVAQARVAGVLCSAIGPKSARLGTHYDVSREDCQKAAKILVGILG